MPYTFNGVCHATPSQALDAFVASFPVADGSGLSTLAAVPTISETGAITYSVQNKSFVTDALVVRDGSVQLPACVEPYADQYPVQSFLILFAFFFALFMGFNSGFRK